MRPTLRNLLRLLDDESIKSVEAKALRQKISESKRAQAIVEQLQRIEQSASETGAQKLPDEQRLAQYLDGNLKETEIDDYEDSILASEQTLATVRRCHQLLLESYIRKAVSVSLSMRESLYELAEADASNSGQSNAPVENIEDLPFIDDAEETPEFPGKSKTISEDDFQQISIPQMQSSAKRKSLILSAVALFALIGVVGVAYWMGQRSQTIKDTATTSKDRQGDVADKDPNAPNEDSDSTTDGDPGDSHLLGELAGPEPLKNVVQPADDANKLPMRPELSLAAWNSNFVSEVPPPDPNAWGEEIGMIADQESIILRADPESLRWSRASTEDPLHENTRILVLDGGHADINLGNEVSVRTTGQTRFDLGRRDKDDDFALSLYFGEIVFQPQINDCGCTINLAGQPALLVFPDPKAQVSFRRQVYYPHGADPRSADRVEYSILYTRFGRCYLHYQDRQITLPADSAWVLTNDGEPEFGNPGDQLQWPTLQLTDRFDRDPLLDRVEAGKDVEAQLVELTNDSRREVRSAAHAALIKIGQLGYVLDFLNDPGNRTDEWRSIIETARKQIQLDPELATGLFEDLASTGPLQAPLYRLVTGYSPDHLENEDGDKQLVEFLDHSELAVRVLAIENLRLITEGKTYMYRADDEGVIRRRSIKRNWNRLLERNEIRYSALPAPPRINLTPINVDDSILPDDGLGGDSEDGLETGDDRSDDTNK